jgi:hypothetical protein
VAPEPAPASSAESVAEDRAVEAEPERPTPGPDLVPLPSFLAVSQPEAAKSGLFSRHLKSLWVRIAMVTVLVPLGGWLGWLGARQYHRLLPRAVVSDPFSLELTVIEYGDSLHLTWNRNAPAIRLGERGILVIADGDQNRSMELDETQLRNGTVIYRRMAGPIRFRLEVILRGGNRSVSESWEAKPPPTPGQSSH